MHAWQKSSNQFDLWFFDSESKSLERILPHTVSFLLSKVARVGLCQFAPRKPHSVRLAKNSSTFYTRALSHECYYPARIVIAEPPIDHDDDNKAGIKVKTTLPEGNLSE